MRYSRDHKARTRRRIVAAAARRFVAQGFDGASIEDVMRDCRLTRGGFYAHFTDKAALYAEALAHAVERGELAGDDTGRLGADAWLESALVADPPALGFLAADGIHRDPRVRRACARAMRRLAERLGAGAGDRGAHTGAVVAAFAATIGGLALARVIDDPAARRYVLEACRRSARDLLGVRRGAPAYFWEPSAD